MPGPSKTPTRILKLRGSWLAKVRGEEPQPSSRPPGTPRDLSKQERRAYRGLCKRFEALGIIDEIDQEKLHRYVVYWCRWVTQVDAIREHGVTPDVAKLEEVLRNIENQFGMSPSARARLALGKPEKQSKEQTEEQRFFG